MLLRRSLILDKAFLLWSMIPIELHSCGVGSLYPWQLGEHAWLWRQGLCEIPHCSLHILLILLLYIIVAIIKLLLLLFVMVNFMSIWLSQECLIKHYFWVCPVKVFPDEFTFELVDSVNILFSLIWVDIIQSIEGLNNQKGREKEFTFLLPVWMFEDFPVAQS